MKKNTLVKNIECYKLKKVFLLFSHSKNFYGVIQKINSEFCLYLRTPVGADKQPNLSLNNISVDIHFTTSEITSFTINKKISNKAPLVHIHIFKFVANNEIYANDNVLQRHCVYSAIRGTLN